MDAVNGRLIESRQGPKLPPGCATSTPGRSDPGATRRDPRITDGRDGAERPAVERRKFSANAWAGATKRLFGALLRQREWRVHRELAGRFSVERLVEAEASRVAKPEALAMAATMA